MSFKSYVARKLSMNKSRLSQILPTTPLINTKRLSDVFRHHISDRSTQIPSAVDLRSNMTPVEDQSNIGSSVAHCLAGAYEYLTKKSNGCNTRVSRLFIDYNARMKNDSSPPENVTGYSIADAIEALELFGTCLEGMWPYDVSNVNTRPSNDAYEQAENHQINKALKINVDLNEMKSCLAQGFPFVFALKLFASFEKAATNGVVVVPRTCEQEQQLSNNHAMLAVGYSDRSNAFIVRNSWGEEWGDQGYCYIPYEYMTNPELCFDLWTIRKIANSDFDREYWHFDDLVDYSDGSDHRSSDDESMNRKEDWNLRRRRHRRLTDGWEQYRFFEGHRSSRNEDDYLNERYRRDRYDRDNEPFDHHHYHYRMGGRADYSFHSYRHLSYPFYDPYRDENNLYRNSNDDDGYHRRSIF